MARATISRYENGALQDESHDKLLPSVMAPSTFLRLVEKSEHVFTEARRKRLITAVRNRQTAS